MNMEFDKHINEYMVYCHSRQLRPKTMHSYESTLTYIKAFHMFMSRL